jgi:outer membrane protein OmpU
MKKVLLAGTAIVGVALLAQPAQADLKLDLGGYFRGYAVYTDNDEDAASYNLRKFEFKKDAEIHFTGETTTDMGLTVGVHAEFKALSNATADYYGGGLGETGTGSPGTGAESYNLNPYNNHQPSLVDESYVYFQGGWGRVNFGMEDGAAYLLQVAAPSADANVDGLRPAIQGFTSDVWMDANAGYYGDVWDPYAYWYGSTGNGMANWVLGYDNAQFRQTDRITYLTPKWNGFQGGVSWAPRNGSLLIGNGTGGSHFDGSDLGNVPNFENLWELAARWDGEFQGFGISAGGGYSHASAQNESNFSGYFGGDDLQQWDAGLNVSYQGWSLGGAYLRSNTATDGPNADYTVWTAGLGWDNGPWHAGASWWRGKWEQNSYGGALTNTDDDLTINRYTVGGGYTFGPGMSFRGAIAWAETDTHGNNDDTSPVQVTFGTDINF